MSFSVFATPVRPLAACFNQGVASFQKPPQAGFVPRTFSPRSAEDNAWHLARRRVRRVGARFGRLRSQAVEPLRLYLVTGTFASVPAMPAALHDGEPEVSRWARCPELAKAWSDMTYRLTRGAIRSGPDGIREVAGMKKGSRRMIPRGWTEEHSPEVVRYGRDHRLRLSSVGSGPSRLVHYIGGFEVGETNARPHFHMVVALPPNMSPAVFWSAWPHGEVRVDVVRQDVRAIAYAVGYSAKSGLRIGRVRTSGRLPKYLIGAVSKALPRESFTVKAEGRAVLRRLARQQAKVCRTDDLYGPLVCRYPEQPDAPPEDDGVMPLSWGDDMVFVRRVPT
jgi:hypothetical protein